MDAERPSDELVTPDFVESPAARRASLARAEKDYAEGHVIPHDQFGKWLRTWGTAEERPAPAEWLE